MCKIDESLTNYFKHNTGGVICINFGETENIIVPEKLRHENILNNFLIDDSILRYYYYPVSNVLSDDEYLEIRHLRPKGDFYELPEKQLLLRPYSINFFGAYYRLDYLLWKFNAILISKKFSPKINGKTIEYLEQLKPYLFDYAKGFIEGFNKFEKNEIEPYLTIFADKQDVATKVFEYATRNLITQSYFSARGFAMSGDFEIKGGFDEGLIQGYYYKAWSLILSNSQSFEHFFNTANTIFIKEKSQQQHQPTQKPQQEITSLSNLICHEKSTAIVESLKVRYKNIQGKRLKLLLIALQNLDMLPKDRIAAKFHRLCTAEFSWPIDSYNAMNKYKYNKRVDENELHEMTEYLKTIVDQ